VVLLAPYGGGLVVRKLGLFFFAQIDQQRILRLLVQELRRGSEWRCENSGLLHHYNNYVTPGGWVAGLVVVLAPMVVVRWPKIGVPCSEPRLISVEF
jgi:hypothetical protein